MNYLVKLAKLRQITAFGKNHGNNVFCDFLLSLVMSMSYISFSVSGPDAWNSLPRQLTGIAVASTFKRHLKSELFFQAYGVSTIASTVADP